MKNFFSLKKFKKTMIEEDEVNCPVTVAYGATAEEAAQILFDGRISKDRGGTGWICALQSHTCDIAR